MISLGEVHSLQELFEKKLKIRKIAGGSSSLNPPQSFSLDKQGRK